MTPLVLEPEERDILEGSLGPAAALGMRIVVRLAGIMRADRLLPIVGAHIDGCLYHGEAGLDLAERLAGLGASVAVPTTLNVGSLDLLHPGMVRGDEQLRTHGKRLMDAYLSTGCRPTWTCAPYQLPGRPECGQHVAWAESNAIVFANSVLGARTDRYGDFIDIAAALTGRVPAAGFHLSENRLADLIVDVSGLPEELRRQDVFYPVLGQLLGALAETRVAAIVGLPAETSEDHLKAVGAAAASSGGVALFHAVGVTPEAPTLDRVLRPNADTPVCRIHGERFRRARDVLSTVPDGARIEAVSVGTPHLSIAEFARLAPLLDGVRVDPGVEFYISTNRHAMEEAEASGWLEICRRAGARIVVDTCTYVTPILRSGVKNVMTNSGKWAYYAPGNLGVGVAFGSLEECVRSAAAGKVVRDAALWRDL